MATVYQFLNVVPDQAQGVLTTTSGLKAMLLSNTFVPNFATMTRRSHLTNEISGSGYTAGGIAITSPGYSTDSDNFRNVITLPAFTFPAFTASDIRFCVVYKSTGSAANDPLFWLYKFSGVEARSSASLIIGQTAATIQLPVYS
jgi:hypothetical protein